MLVMSAGFMMGNFEIDDTDGLKGQGCAALPFGAWEDPPLAALHHLHQVSHLHTLRRVEWQYLPNYQQYSKHRLFWSLNMI